MTLTKTNYNTVFFYKKLYNGFLFVTKVCQISDFLSSFVAQQSFWPIDQILILTFLLFNSNLICVPTHHHTLKLFQIFKFYFFCYFELRWLNIAGAHLPLVVKYTLKWYEENNNVLGENSRFFNLLDFLSLFLPTILYSKQRSWDTRYYTLYLVWVGIFYLKSETALLGPNGPTDAVECCNTAQQYAIFGCYSGTML